MHYGKTATEKDERKVKKMAKKRTDLITIPYDDFLSLCNIVLRESSRAKKAMEEDDPAKAREILDGLHDGFCKVKFRAIDLDITNGTGW